jgi:hypothetical protein
MGSNSGLIDWRVNIIFNWYSGGGVQLGPLDTAATNRPIVPAPGEYDDGEIGGMTGRGNRSTRRKPAPVPLCPPQTPRADWRVSKYTSKSFKQWFLLQFHLHIYVAHTAY